MKKTSKIDIYQACKLLALDLNSFLEFLCIENLTSSMKHPCMMDLKMGSVPYNPKKTEKQLLKINSSTSGKLGFRVCGLEVFQSKTKKIIFRNKYWGR